MIYVALALMLTSRVFTLSGSTVSAYCHCDLIPQFCDVGCCCDVDCSSIPTSDCYNSKSNSYCPDPTFFSRLGSTYLNSQGCFYYNSTSTVQEEVSLSTRQTTQIINQQLSVSRVVDSQAPIWAGYQQSDLLSVSGNSNLYLLNSDGTCLITANSSTPPFNLRFGMNTKIQCTCGSCGASIPQLFLAFSGKTIPKYNGDTIKNLTLPTISDSGITDVQITFVVGSYGSQRIKYIQRVTSSTTNSGSSIRSITFSWVQTSSITQQSSSPSFFPQIPQDMFYPIYLLS